jgi:hypothetical protein
MYVLYFIINLLEKTKSVSYFKKNRIPDENMEEFRTIYFNKINMEMDISNSELTAIPYDTSSIMYYNNDLYEVDNVSCDDRTNTVQFKISTFDVGDKKLTIDVNRGDKKIATIPKDMQHTCIFYYNEDGYSMHCRKYKEYEEWLKNRNTQRYVEIENHQQSIDGKNMMHTRRLLDMAKEIALGQGINVRRPNAEFLISIRQGKVNLEDLIQHAEDEIKEIDKLYIESNLPDNVDMNFVNDLLIEIRKHFYLLEYVKIQDQLVIEAREKEA